VGRRNLKSAVTVDLEGNLARKARTNGKSLTNMARNGERDMRRLTRATRNASFGFNGLSSSIGGYLTGAAVVMSGKGVVDLEERLTQLQTDGRASVDQIAAFKQELFDVSNDKNIRLNPDKILSGFEEIITRTGDIDFATENLRNLALAIRATNAEGGDVGAVLSNLYKAGVRDPERVLSVMDSLIEQTKTGSVAFRDLSKEGNKLFAPYIAAGRTGEQAIKDMGAIAQVVIDAVGSAAEASEATKGLLADLHNPEKQAKLGAKGIKIFDDGQLRALPELITEIFEAAEGDMTKLSSVFGETAIKVFAGLSIEGNLEKMRELAALQETGANAINSAAINANTAAAALQSLSNSWGEVMDDLLTDPLGSGVDALNKTKDGSVESAMQAALVGAGGLYAGGKIFKHLPAKMQMSLKTSLGLLRGVDLKNFKMMGAGALGTAVTGVAAAGYGGYQVGTSINDNFIEGTDLGESIGRNVARVLAFFGNDEAQASLDAERRYNEFLQQQKVEGTIRLVIDSEGQPRVNQLESSGIGIEVDTGIVLE